MEDRRVDGNKVRYCVRMFGGHTGMAILGSSEVSWKGTKVGGVEKHRLSRQDCLVAAAVEGWGQAEVPCWPWAWLQRAWLPWAWLQQAWLCLGLGCSRGLLAGVSGLGCLGDCLLGSRGLLCTRSISLDGTGRLGSLGSSRLLGCGGLLCCSLLGSLTQLVAGLDPDQGTGVSHALQLDGQDLLPCGGQVLGILQQHSTHMKSHSLPLTAAGQLVGRNSSQDTRAEWSG
ncbi:hypothetical protein HaLaN_27497 [Haematococcus lacustris]|uniref:Uncharacterized protein n=1 Tax=Haematococcus lacustris TaxID=44745 RepID=A0A6A0A8P6_HAELA|nr:hypothetical protein HaLaN_27497 [Haematococcus lacustris]